VFVPGAKFFVGDPHYRQGDGEVALTALEAPLRGTFRLTVLKHGSKAIPGGRGQPDAPFGENADFWIPAAYAYMSAATDYVVSQVVDKTKGVHARISKNHFERR
jgi:acetamidase/formamidase